MLNLKKCASNSKLSHEPVPRQRLIKMLKLRKPKRTRRKNARKKLHSTAQQQQELAEEQEAARNAHIALGIVSFV